ncbi:hypothetical protein HU200_011109 [Digitaria exilis]|uniref:Uncharacterized protein n=1 Tax=Digitaria exilis TaxID=1010633 RepID=A0A835FH62_9POAL|nr:hypothetical protein HU200_011109 [Digitaria exilis]CAB3465900.1 unnamed protein product [Digitaria exilis]
MAHHHSPSPSGGSSRRLSELLGEQQEPFYLDLYLLEKGCSSTFLDAAACGGGACSTCWPKARSGGGGSRLLRRPPARSKKKGPRRNGGVFRLLLSKFLSGATPAAPVARKKRRRQRQQPAAIGWRRVDVDEKQSTPGPSRNAVECHHTEVVDDEQPEEDDDDDEEDESSSKKQLSPVSVLEQRLFEHSPPPPHTQRALVLFSELLEAAYAPSTLLHLLANAKQYSISVSNKSRGDDKAPPPTTTRRRSRRKKKKNGGGRRKGDDDTAFERDLARATALVGSEMAGGARVRPEDVAAEREEVADDIAAAVLEELTEELMLVAMGMLEMDHGGCAARRRR